MLLMTMIISSVHAQHGRFNFKLIEGRGLLSRTSGASWLSLKPGQPVSISENDMLRVEGSGRGVVNYPDGSRVKMSQNAEVTVYRDAVELQVGNIWLRIRQRNDVFRVFTPMASCSVLGTSFDVNTNRFGHTTVRVFSGLVAVRANNDQRNRQLVLQQGMQTTVSDSSKVADTPGRFQASTVAQTLESQWSVRVLPSTIRQPEVTIAEPEPELEKIIDQIEYVADKIEIMPRQRTEFQQMMIDEHIKRTSVIGHSTAMDGRTYRHGAEYGHSVSRLSQHELEREYSRIRNRLLRVQSKLRQSQIQARQMVDPANPSAAYQRRVQSLQAQIRQYENEQKFLQQRLREIQVNKK